MVVRDQNHVPAASPPGKRPCTYFIEGWVERRAGLDGWGKYRSPPGFVTQTVQTVVSRYSNYAVPAGCILGDQRRVLML